mgnify:CR=1 FL=1
MYEELLVKEEGIQKTDNNLIYIGKPLEFNEVHFLSGLRELEEAAMNESLNVKTDRIRNRSNLSYQTGRLETR